MVKTLAAAAIVWPILLGTIVWHRATHGEAVWTTIAQVAASRLCHQRPERSFFTVGVQWPVCGRCSGLYLGAAAGAVAALLLQRRGRLGRVRGPILLAVAAAPTALSLGAEWSHLLDVGNAGRFVTALPLGSSVLLAMASAVASHRTVSARA